MKVKRPSVIDWVLNHPYWACGVFLALEALLPVRYQPTAWTLRGAIRLYQLALSPAMPHCPFTPTCSHYGHACIQRFGTLRGGVLTAWRLLRCHPGTKGGFDPPPGA
jgi:putative membrane protein insertion efficiency factor